MAILKQEKNEAFNLGEKGHLVIADNQHAKVVKTLIKGMYQDKFSWIREILCNALDSETIKPVEIILTEPDVINDNYQQYLVIRDYGKGMSYQQLMDIYFQLGNSTKQADNTKIGSFGYGSKSPLKYADYFYVETNYNGLKTAFTINSDDNGYVILIKNQPTEDIGTTVKVPIDNKDVGTIQSFINATFYLKDEVVFKNLSYNCSLKNNIAYECDDFVVTKKTVSQSLVLYDKLIYNFPKEFLNLIDEKFRDNFIFKFKIGELQPLEPRESINYEVNKDEVLELIKEKSLKVQQYLTSLSKLELLIRFKYDLFDKDNQLGLLKYLLKYDKKKVRLYYYEEIKNIHCYYEYPDFYLQNVLVLDLNKLNLNPTKEGYDKESYEYLLNSDLFVIKNRNNPLRTSTTRKSNFINDKCLVWVNKPECKFTYSNEHHWLKKTVFYGDYNNDKFDELGLILDFNKYTLLKLTKNQIKEFGHNYTKIDDITENMWTDFYFTRYMNDVWKEVDKKWVFSWIEDFNSVFSEEKKYFNVQLFKTFENAINNAKMLEYSSKHKLFNQFNQFIENVKEFQTKLQDKEIIFKHVKKHEFNNQWS